MTMSATGAGVERGIAQLVTLRNGRSIPSERVPLLNASVFRQTLAAELSGGARLVAFYGRATQGDRVRVFAVLGRDQAGTLGVAACDVATSLDSLVPDHPQASPFEREIHEQWGIEMRGHPWLKPFRLQSLRPRGDGPRPSSEGAKAEPGPLAGETMAYFRVEGTEVHEVAVGPVHAGVIEPGHFRFQCSGELVMHLEISLGYQHRGIEAALLGGSAKRRVHYLETCAGDTTVGHATAYCQAMEALAGCRVPARALALRGVALELERIANHTGDLGALAGDIGFLPTASYCGRLRGDVLNMTALMCGNRFGRGFVRPGGIAWDVDEAMREELLSRLDQIETDLKVAIERLWETPSVLSRFDGTGRLSSATCVDLGIVGVAARAAGVDRDVRRDFATGIYRLSQVPVSTWSSGDVYGRALVRWLEIQRSITFVREQLRSLPGGAPTTLVPNLAPNTLTVSLTEGWRGEIVHAVETSVDGQIIAYKIVDPSVHNWFGLAVAMRGQAISDFPLCNKSFNLSYCGNDL